MVDFQKTIALYLAWLGGLALALIAGLADALPFRLSFLGPGSLWLAFLELRLFFVLLVWPLFARALAADALRVALHLPVLLLLSFPLLLVCANVSSTPPGWVWRGELLLLGWGAFAATLFVFARGRRVEAGPSYVLAVLVLSAALPWLAFLEREAGGGRDLSFLAYASPFWAAARVEGGPALAQGVAALLAALALFAAGSAFRKSVDAPKPAG